jgi:hypothetical protein
MRLSLYYIKKFKEGIILKKLLLAGIMLILFGTPAMASNGVGNDCIWFSAGGGPKNTISLGIGGRGKENIGGEISFAYSSKYSDILDYPCPHGSYRILDNKAFDYALGGDLLYFKDIKKTNAVLYIGAGIYILHYREVAQSTVTGWLYEQDDDIDFEATYTLGIQHQVGQRGTFGIGYHSLRGICVKYIWAK